jgi:hypothetical protein
MGSKLRIIVMAEPKKRMKIKKRKCRSYMGSKLRIIVMAEPKNRAQNNF